MHIRNLAIGAIVALGASLSLQAQCGEALVGASIGTGDDVVLPMQALGFAFPFNGTTYTHVHPSTNGFVWLSNAGVPAAGGALCCTGTTATLVAGSPIIAPFWSDLNMILNTGSVKFNALPGKVVITWENAVEYSTTTPTFTFQLQLGVGGDIRFTYDNRVQIATAGDYLVGMSQGGGATVPATSDFSVAGTTAGVTSFELFNNTGLTFDLASTSVLFVPTGSNYVFVPGPCAPASHTTYGTGCYDRSDSLYELFADAAIASAALSNQSIQFLPVGTNYLVSWGGGTYVPPSGSAANLTVNAADDLEVLVTPSVPLPTPAGPQATLRVHTNGIVCWGGVAQTFPGTNNYTPTAAGFLNAVDAGIYAWHDYNEAEAGSGRIKREEVGSTLYLTWENVENYANPTVANPTTMQFQLNLSTGVVTIVWTTVDSNTTSTFGSAHLVGYSPAGNSIDGGPVTLATALPVVTSAGMSALALTGAPKPVSTPTAGSSIVYTTSNIPEFVATSGLYVAVNILSLTQVPAPGLDLAFLGAPGCVALVGSLDVTQAMVGVSSTQTVTFNLPAGVPSGLLLYSQSAALVQPGTLNAFGLATSNGLVIQIGEW